MSLNSHWNHFLSSNIVLTKIFLFNSHPDFIFCGSFFILGLLGGLKSVSGDIFGHTDSIGSFKKRIFVFRPKIDFLQGVSQCFLAKNDQILKSAFYTSLCP